MGERHDERPCRHGASGAVQADPPDRGGRDGLGVPRRAVFTGRHVALKFLKPRSDTNDDQALRFRQEARIAGRLRHPNIVEVLDGDVAPEGVFVVFELLEGETVGEVIRTRKRVAPAEAAAVTFDLLTALSHIHCAGVLHRDVKPDNIFLVRGADGAKTVKLLDFGVAKVLAPSVDDHHIRVQTNAGVSLGTPAYMSPEQLTCDTGIDLRADLWSVGATLFRMLTGRAPFGSGDVLITAQRVLTEDAPVASSLAPEVPPELDAVIARALRRKPSERYETAEAMRDAVRDALDVLMETTQRSRRSLSLPPPTPAGATPGASDDAPPMAPPAIPRRARSVAPTVLACAVLLTVMAGVRAFDHPAARAAVPSRYVLSRAVEHPTRAEAPFSPAEAPEASATTAASTKLAATVRTKAVRSHPRVPTTTEMFTIITENPFEETR